MITNEVYFFKNQSSVSTSDSLYNVNDGTLILQVDGNVSNLELLVLGNTDLIDDDFVALKTINASDYSMSDKITSTDIYWIDINEIRKIKLNLSKITGSVNVKALTKRGLTTDLVARAMAANASGGSSYTLPVASADTLGGIKIGENLTIDENGVVSASNKSVPVYFIENNNEGNGYLVNFYGLASKTSEFTEILNDVAAKGSSTFIISCYSTSVTNGRSAPGILYQAYKFTLSKSGGSIRLSGFFYGRSPTSPYRPEFNVHNATILYSYNSSNNKYNCTEVKLLSDDKITMPLASDVLMKTNTSSYTPTSDYNPATKKYVDDAITTAITTSLEGSY